MFNENEIFHPSREKRVGVSTRKQRDYKDDGATYRPKRNGDNTIRPQDVHRVDSSASETVRPSAPQLPPRGPSPPIVVIEPLHRPHVVPPPSPSPVEEQDNATSESSTSSRRSGKRIRYRVANPGGDEATTRYEFVPPPLPVASPYSARLGTSSKHNLTYMPEPDRNPPPRSRSSSNPHFAPTPPDSSSGFSPRSHTSSKSSSSSSSSLPQSSSTEDSSTWKRPPGTAPGTAHGTAPGTVSGTAPGTPVTAPVNRMRASSSSSSHSRSEQGSSSSSGYHRQLRTPPHPTVPPPPVPPLQTPPPSTVARTPPPLPTTPLPVPPSSSPSLSYATLPQTTTKPQAPEDALGRPNASDVVRRLGDYFPDHDLDQPVVVPSSSTDDLTERPTPSIPPPGRPHRVTRNFEDETTPGSSTSQQHRMTGLISGRFSFSQPSSLNLFSSLRTGSATRREQPSPPSSSSANRRYTNHPPESAAASPVSRSDANSSRRLGYTKSIRRVAEERQSNPDKARKRTLWGIKMEELRALPPTPGSSRQNDSGFDDS